MSEKLREYAVLGVSQGGRYAVRHKTSGEMFSWRPIDARKHSKEHLEAIQDDVKLASTVRDDTVLKYRDTIHHSPTNTLYIVLEHSTWCSLEEIVNDCKRDNKCFRESYLWYLLHETAKACKSVHSLDLKVMATRISLSSIYIDVSGAVKIDCLDIADDKESVVNHIGLVLKHLCCLRVEGEGKPFSYSNDLEDIVNFLLEEASQAMKPDVILYHPTVLANLECTMESKSLTHVLVAHDHDETIECDSENALEVCNTVIQVNSPSGPVYMNLSPKRLTNACDENVLKKNSISPTIAALALELPGFVPRNAKNELALYNDPQQISERTLSQQWMSRLIALRERENSLHRRELDLISKEILNSPSVKAILPKEPDLPDNDGITLPPIMAHSIPQEKKDDKQPKKHRRSSSVRTRNKRRQSYNYDDLDSSLSACDGSVIVTATKFNKENMPRRSIFPEVGSKKVHFPSQNPFVDSDDSVTLTFYELENIDREGYQVPRNREYTTRQMADDIAKFKYIDLEKVTQEKRTALDQWNTSPSKQAKFAVPVNQDKKALTDITNSGEFKMSRTPSKVSINSKASTVSKLSGSSMKSAMSMESEKSKSSFQSCISSGSRISTRLKNADKLFGAQKKPITRQSMLPVYNGDDEVKKSKSRKSLLPFKTPFKFMSRAQ